MAEQFEPTKGEYFIFWKGAGGNEFNQNYRYDLATGEITLLTDGKSRNCAPTWSNNGDRIVYTSTRRNGADTDIYVESPTDPKSDKMIAEVKGGGWDPADWSPDDKQLLVIEGISDQRKLHLAVRRADRGEKRSHAPPGRRRGEGLLLQRAIFQGRQRDFRHDRSRIGIPAPGIHRPRERQAHLPQS